MLNYQSPPKDNTISDKNGLLKRLWEKWFGQTYEEVKDLRTDLEKHTSNNVLHGGGDNYDHSDIEYHIDDTSIHFHVEDIDHNSVSGIQGGDVDEAYHLDLDTYTEVQDFFDGGLATQSDVDEHIADADIHFTKDSLPFNDLVKVKTDKCLPVAFNDYGQPTQVEYSYLGVVVETVNITYNAALRPITAVSVVGGETLTISYTATGLFNGSVIT